MLFNKNKKGFTLIEVLVTLAIFSILVSGASWFIIGSNRDLAVMWEQLVTQNQGKKTLEHVINYVRKAETSSVGSYPLNTTEPYNLIFYANVDSNNMIEKVQFWLDDKTLKETITHPSSTASSNIYENGTSQTIDLADNVKNMELAVPVFLYYNESYTGSQSELLGNFNLTDIRMIKVQLELEKDPNKSPEPLHVESMALIRSTKRN
ncbi:MAG: prepilin-type N-terminal cleavage/methylation domain-containing protein [Patescibacteria group bacterium]|nr:prepilin-type N-terminal cleavage/methylation domain-containing protein [Patescibacteria group bacterium]